MRRLRHAFADSNAARIRLQIHSREITRIRSFEALRKAVRAARVRPGNYFIVLRIAELGNIAWREGRDEARSLEARCVRVLDAVGQRILRANDIIAHDPGTGDICILLRSRRNAFRLPMPGDARNVVHRLIAALRQEMALAIDYGWLHVHDVASDEVDVLCETALQRGKVEAERFAFFAAVGHELRTPLAAIRGSLEIVCDPQTNDTAAQRFAGIAYRETLRLTRLVEDLFTLSLDDDRDVSGSHAASVRAAIEEAAATQTIYALDAGIRIGIEIPDDLPAVVIPADRLVQIFVILFDNAIKHGGRITCITAHARMAGDGFVRIVIEDDGGGIEIAHRDRIFSFGERGASGAAGTGIGLALVRKFVERFDGSVTCSDGTLGGAAFTLHFRVAAEPASASASRFRNQQQCAPITRGNVA